MADRGNDSTGALLQIQPRGVDLQYLTGDGRIARFFDGGSLSTIPGAPGAVRDTDHSFLGHPRGLAYIAFTEAWERFSYYGMQALLVLYMVNRLLHPGHIENIAGFGPFRHLIEIFRGQLSIQALASTIFGLYTGLV